jgi:hypothetical protein
MTRYFFRGQFSRADTDKLMASAYALCLALKYHKNIK